MVVEFLYRNSTVARYFCKQTVAVYIISLRYVLYALPLRRAMRPLSNYALRILANETSTPAETNTRRSAP